MDDLLDFDIQRFEQLSAELYSHPSEDARNNAQQQLDPLFVSSTRNLSAYMRLLDNVTTIYGQYCILQLIEKCVGQNWSALNSDTQRDLHAKLLNMVGFQSDRFTATNQFTALLRLYARVLKYGWVDSKDFRASLSAIVDSCLVPDIDNQRVLGIKTLVEVTKEMSTRSPGRTITQNRKATMMFRDKTLLSFMELSVSQLRRLYGPDASSSPLHDQIKTEYLNLACACLDFDFTCTSYVLDPTSDQFSLQIPSTWRSLVQTDWLLTLFFDIYRTESPPRSTLAIECISQLSAVKTSLLPTDADKLTYLNQLITGALRAMQNNLPLRDEAEYHMFCQLIFRLKPPFFTFRHVTRCVNFNDYIEALTQFTVASLAEYSSCKNGIHYLMKTWSRLSKNAEGSFGGETYNGGQIPLAAAQITQKFIGVYLSEIREAYTDGSYQQDDPLDDSQLEAMLDSISTLARSCYPQAAELLGADLVSLTNVINRGEATLLVEAEAAWILRVVAAVVEGRLTPGNESHDAELAGKAMAMLRAVDRSNEQAQSGTVAHINLEFAALLFLDAFKTAFISDNELAMRIYPAVQRDAGISNTPEMLAYTLDKLFWIIRVYPNVGRLVDRAFHFANKLTGNYYTGKTLPGLPIVRDILERYAADFQLFFQPDLLKKRTKLYHILGVLLFTQEDSGVVDRFVRPMLLSVSEAVKAVQQSTDQSAQLSVIRACRDVSGLLKAIQKYANFTAIYDILLPQTVSGPAPTPFFAMLETIARESPTEAELAIPILRVVTDFITGFQKSYDVSFDRFSTAGYRIFGSASKTMLVIAQAFLQLIPTIRERITTESDLWPRCYKVVYHLLQAVNKAVQTSFCNFGVFQLFGDNTVEAYLDTLLEIVASIPPDDILSHVKLSRTVFSFIQTIARSHIVALARMEGNTLARLVQLLVSAMVDNPATVSAASVSSPAAESIENLVTYIVEGTQSTTPFRNELARVLQDKLNSDRETLTGVLHSMFDIVLYRESPMLYSLSKAMLPVMVLISDELPAVRQTLLDRCDNEVDQAEVARCYDKLLVGVSGIDDVDAFQTNLQLFSSSVNGLVR
ncbi:putative Exportin-7 [Carpediemonas membranifera]|uniref:Putative Exportin-7 n=1 Tax=Carpediemonas membranifera TaxID=201153 RepID=A0A8J6BG93_9EUKA|nr:putative Exportin-7 [Carpediemonas membranifera]|eukprot:KAG9396867.1 putative Exportin-7 [Carpediemonas membranifera]